MRLKQVKIIKQLIRSRRKWGILRSKSKVERPRRCARMVKGGLRGLLICACHQTGVVWLIIRQSGKHYDSQWHTQRTMWGNERPRGTRAKSQRCECESTTDLWRLLATALWAEKKADDIIDRQPPMGKCWDEVKEERMGG